MEERRLEEILELADDADIREDTASLSARITEDDLSLESSVMELRLRYEELQGKKQDRQQRKDFVYHIFTFICTYMAVVMIMVFLSGVQATFFHLSDAVIITMLTTTLANVLGLFVIVTKYLFHTKE